MGRDQGGDQQDESRSVQPARDGGKHRSKAGETQAHDRVVQAIKLEAVSERKVENARNARRLVALAPCSIAVGILIGGEKHFGTQFFDFQRRYAPWWLWGFIFLLCSLWMLMTKDTKNMFWCAMISSMVMAMWTMTTLLSILADPTRSAPTASIGLYALVCFYLAFVAGRSERPRMRRK